MRKNFSIILAGSHSHGRERHYHMAGRAQGRFRTYL